MLAVLFVVTLVRSREQNLEIQRLRQRVRALESSRSFDRSAAQDEQLRALGQRLQRLSPPGSGVVPLRPPQELP
jgi:hypothetical protein